MPDLSARQIGTTALRLLGVAAAEVPLSADMSEQALHALNAMLSGWATERLLTFTRPKIAVPLVPGQGVYTWGLVPGELVPADISAPPPIRIELCLLTLPGPPPYEDPIPVLTQAQYEAGVWDKAMPSSYPEAVYLEMSQPYARLHVWGVPSLPYTLQLFPWQEREPYTHWDHVLSWPAGYERAMQHNLAVELGPQYGVEASGTVMRIAEESKRLIGNVNAQVGRLTSDYGGAFGRSDIPAVDMDSFYRGRG